MELRLASGLLHLGRFRRPCLAPFDTERAGLDGRTDGTGPHDNEVSWHEVSPPQPPPRGADAGSTLVEVMMAVLILMMATVALAAVLTQAVSAVSFSRQSQQASNLAASVLAQAESMPWSTSPSSADANYGLTTSDVSLDTNLTSDGSGGYCFEGMHVVVQGIVGTGTCGSTWTWKTFRRHRVARPRCCFSRP